MIPASDKEFPYIRGQPIESRFSDSMADHRPGYHLKPGNAKIVWVPKFFADYYVEIKESKQRRLRAD